MQQEWWLHHDVLVERRQHLKRVLVQCLLQQRNQDPLLHRGLVALFKEQRHGGLKLGQARVLQQAVNPLQFRNACLQRCDVALELLGHFSCAPEFLLAGPPTLVIGDQSTNHSIPGMHAPETCPNNESMCGLPPEQGLLCQRLRF
jgi:hypothetical protein